MSSPSSARGPIFLVLHMYNRSVLQYCRYKKRADTKRTNEISFNIKDVACSERAHQLSR